MKLNYDIAETHGEKTELLYLRLEKKSAMQVLTEERK